MTKKSAAKEEAVVLPPISQMIWDMKYRYRREDRIVDQTVEDTWRRVAKAVARVALKVAALAMKPVKAQATVADAVAVAVVVVAMSGAIARPKANANVSTLKVAQWLWRPVNPPP